MVQVLRKQHTGGRVFNRQDSAYCENAIFYKF